MARPKIKSKNPAIRKLLATPTKQVKANIRKYFDMARPYELQDGRAWYVEAHTLAVNLADECFLASTAHAAGVIAALSPSCAWERNVVDAKAVCAARSFDPTPVVATYGPNLGKAVEIRDGGNPLEVLGGKKVRAFFECIENPYTCRRAVIDRHAFCVAFDSYVPRDIIGTAVKLAGVYEWLETCYQEVATELSMFPHEVQATTWLVWRRVKGDVA